MGLSLNNFWWLSVAVAGLVLLLLWRYAYHSHMAVLDAQTDRSLHHGQALTGAGILMFIPWCLCGLLLAPLFVPFYVILLLSVLGFIDDRYDVSFKLRLLLQIFAAVLTLYALNLTSHLALMVFLTFSLIWWVNLFNFMDGANGMAALHAAVSMTFYGLVLAEKFNQPTVFSYMSLAGVLILLVYMIFNLWLKKLFMGDSGSLPLAWILAVLALFAIFTDTLSYAQVAVVHAVFIVDASLTLLMRLKRGENITQAHATHLYQRLIKSGHSHLRVSGCYAIFTLLCCVLLWFTLFSSLVVQYAILAAIYLILLMIFMKSLRSHPYTG